MIVQLEEINRCSTYRVRILFEINHFFLSNVLFCLSVIWNGFCVLFYGYFSTIRCFKDYENFIFSFFAIYQEYFSSVEFIF